MKKKILVTSLIKEVAFLNNFQINMHEMLIVSLTDGTIVQ